MLACTNKKNVFIHHHSGNLYAICRVCSPAASWSFFCLYIISEGKHSARAQKARWWWMCSSKDTVWGGREQRSWTDVRRGVEVVPFQNQSLQPRDDGTWWRDPIHSSAPPPLFSCCYGHPAQLSRCDAGYHPKQDASHVETNSRSRSQVKPSAKSELPVWPDEAVFGLCEGAGVAARSCWKVRETDRVLCVCVVLVWDGHASLTVMGKLPQREICCVVYLCVCWQWNFYPYARKIKVGILYFLFSHYEWSSFPNLVMTHEQNFTFKIITIKGTHLKAARYSQSLQSRWILTFF